MTGFLVCEDGPLSEWVFSFEGNTSWILGRDGDICNFTIQDPMVSRKHITVSLEDDTYFVENNSSTNPALINDQEISEKTKLNENDILQIGNNTFRFTFTAPKKPEKTAVDEKSDEEVHHDPHEPSQEQQSPPEPLTLGQFPVEETDAKWLIKVISGPAAGAQFPLYTGQSYVIGSDSESSDILINDLSVSKNHTRITISDSNEPAIIDLNSKNGLYVKGKKIDSDKVLEPNDHITIGTTSLLFIDIEHTRDTIYSPGIAKHIAEENTLYSDEEQQEEETKEEEEEEKEKNWKETFIPAKHIAVASIFSLFICFSFISMLALFRTTTVTVEVIDKTDEIKKAISHFEGVTFNYNANTSTLFLTGHVLSDLRHNEMTFELGNISDIDHTEDNIIIDQSVVNNINSLILKNQNWQSILMTASVPGRYILTGYLTTEEEKARLRDFVNNHFNFLNLLDNQVVVEETLNANINSVLLENGFLNVIFQQNNGRVVLSGRAHKSDETKYETTIDEIQNIHGVRMVKNFVIYNTKSTAAISLNEKYKVSGSSKYGQNNQFVLINGRILGVDDKLDGMIITRITNSEILLEREGIKYKIDYNI